MSPRRLNGEDRPDFVAPAGAWREVLSPALPAESDATLEWLSLAAYFWAGVERGARDDCWPWRGFLDKNGYGQVFRSRKAHQIAFQLVNGPIPDGLFVCHTCDYPACCNPQHLFAGTALDNTRDMIAKGRDRLWGHPKGGGAK